MKYYLELKLLPDDDISAHFLLAKVYTQLHIAFAEIKNAEHKINIGVSFPQYRFNQEKVLGFWVKNFGFLPKMKLI